MINVCFYCSDRCIISLAGQADLWRVGKQTVKVIPVVKLSLESCLFLKLTWKCTRNPFYFCNVTTLSEMGYSTRTCVIFILMFLYFISRYFLLVFEEPEDPSNRSFFSEIISSVSDVKFSHSGRYLMTRDYLTVKVWDLNMESKPLETYQVWHWVI